MNENRKLFPKVLKVVSKGFGFSMSLAVILWLLMILGFSTWNPPIKTETEQILLVNIRLNGIILSFTIGLFVFIMDRLKPEFYEWALTIATASFTSFFLSIFFGFISVLSSTQITIFFPLLPISFTIIGIISDWAFLLYAAYKFKEKKLQNSKHLNKV